MRRIAVLTALTLAAGLGFTATASATECTPKGCTASCYPPKLDVDPRSGTVTYTPAWCNN